MIPKIHHKTFKGKNADDKLLDYINTYNICFYTVESYSGKKETDARTIKIFYDHSDMLRPNGDD